MAIAVRDFVGGLELLVILVLDAERAADIVHAILIRRGIVAAGRLVVNAVDGLRSADPGLIRMMRTLHGDRLATFRRVEWPGALPSICSGARIAATYAAVWAVFGEWAGSQSGLGWQMLQAKGRLDTALVFADIVFITLMALGLFGLVSLVERLTIPWARKGGATTGGDGRGRAPELGVRGGRDG